MLNLYCEKLFSFFTKESFGKKDTAIVIKIELSYTIFTIKK